MFVYPPEWTFLSTSSMPELYHDSSRVHVAHANEMSTPWILGIVKEVSIQDMSQVRHRILLLLGEFSSLWKQMTNSSSRPLGLGTVKSIIHFCFLSWLQPGCSFSSQHPHVVYEETSSRYLLVVRLRRACPDTPSCPNGKNQSLVLLGSGRLQSSD